MNPPSLAAQDHCAPLHQSSDIPRCRPPQAGAQALGHALSHRPHSMQRWLRPACVAAHVLTPTRCLQTLDQSSQRFRGCARLAAGQGRLCQQEPQAQAPPQRHDPWALQHRMPECQHSLPAASQGLQHPLHAASQVAGAHRLCLQRQGAHQPRPHPPASASTLEHPLRPAASHPPAADDTGCWQMATPQETRPCPPVPTLNPYLQPLSLRAAARHRARWRSRRAPRAPSRRGPA